MSMFDILNSTLQILLKIALLSNILNNKKISIWNAISIINLFLLGSIWFTIYYYSLNRFLYIYKIFQLTEQNLYVQVTYRNLMFFWAHSRASFLNNVGDTIFFNSVGKMPHKMPHDSFNTSNLQHCVISKTIIAFLLWKYFC